MPLANPAQTRERNGEFGPAPENTAASVDLAPELNLAYRLDRGGETGSYNVENDITQPPATTEGGITSMVFRVGGTPHINTRQKAIGALFPFDERDDAAGAADALAADGKKMTVLTIGSSGYPVIREGAGAIYRDKPILMVKGSRTKFREIAKADIVATRPGYGGMDKLLAEYNHRSAIVPQLDATTFDGLPERGEDDPTPNEVNAVYLLDSHDFGEGATSGCVFLATCTDGDDVYGYFWAPDGATVFAEHGPFSKTHLHNRGGRVADYQPGSITLDDIDRLGGTYESAYGFLAASGQ